MVSNEAIHSELKKRFNRVTSNHGKSVNTEEWDSYFNEAYRAWVKARVPKAKTNNKVRYDLRKLEVIDQKVEIRKGGKTWLIAVLPNDYYDVLRVIPTANREGCPDRELVVTIAQGNDWSETIKDPYWSPSYLWARTLADENSQGLRIGTGDFNIIGVTIDYYRKPSPIYSPELQDCEYSGALKVLGNRNIGFELDDMQMDEVVDFAVYFASRDSGSFEDAKSQMEKTLTMYNNL